MYSVDAERDFGVRADNLTDNTAALTLALAAGGVTLLPAGLIRCQGIVPPAGARIVGVGAGGFAVPVDPSRQTILRLMPGQMTTAMIRGVQGAAHVSLENLNLDGGKAGGVTASGIVLDPCPAEEGQWRIRNCYVHEFTGDGLNVGSNRRAVKIGDHSVFLRNNGNGIVLNGSDAGIMDAAAGGNGGAGVLLGGGVARVRDCDIWGNLTGIQVADGGVSQITIAGCGIDRNLQHGIHLGASFWNASLIGNLLHSNSQAADGLYHHVNAPHGSGLMMCGNSFGADSGMTNLPGYGVYLGDTVVSGSGNVLHPGATRQGLTNAPSQFSN